MRVFRWTTATIVLLFLLCSGCMRPVEQNSPLFEMTFFVQASNGTLHEISLDHPLPVGTELTAKASWTKTAGPSLPPYPDTTISLDCTVPGIVEIVEPLSGYPLGYQLRVAGAGSTELQFICRSESQHTNWYTSNELTGE